MPDSVLKAALLRRATEDINRVLTLRSQRQALMTLQQRGSVGDDLWQRFQRAESEMEDEVRDVIAEVFSFLWAAVLGWCHEEKVFADGYGDDRQTHTHRIGVRPSFSLPTR